MRKTPPLLNAFTQPFIWLQVQHKDTGLVIRLGGLEGGPKASANKQSCSVGNPGSPIPHCADEDGVAAARLLLVSKSNSPSNCCRDSEANGFDDCVQSDGQHPFLGE